jgi:hypothetical protein
MNDESQVEENLKTAETALPNSMTEEELATMGQVAAAYKKLMKVPCTACAYCMPCPQGVNIPRNFQMFNQAGMFGGGVMARGMYAAMLMGLMTGLPADASLCVNCGACAKKCPQHIAIPAELKKVRKSLGGWKTKLLLPMIKKRVPHGPPKKD